MTWTRVLACWLLAAVLGVVFAVTGVERPPRGGEVPAPSGSPEPRRAYDLARETLRRIEVRRGDLSVVLERGDAGWRAVEPATRTIPIGLVQAFVGQLVDGGGGERIDGDPRDPSYGLARPQLVIFADAASGADMTLAVGDRTPTGTAAYGLVEEEGAVVLVGLNLLYYADLLFGG